jgi:bifunctional DNA-binding transcriptional regulator/antitoxin component of YhaV-PrlF toxin-antitoxin module
MANYIHTKLGEDRRLAIPMKVCQRHGFQAGERVVLEETENGLRLIPYRQIIQEVQAAFAPYRQPGVDAVDELIADRRREFALEEAKAEKHLTVQHGESRE